MNTSDRSIFSGIATISEQRVEDKNCKAWPSVRVSCNHTRLFNAPGPGTFGGALFMDEDISNATSSRSVQENPMLSSWAMGKTKNQLSEL